MPKEGHPIFIRLRAYTFMVRDLNALKSHHSWVILAGVSLSLFMLAFGLYSVIFEAAFEENLQLGLVAVGISTFGYAVGELLSIGTFYGSIVFVVYGSLTPLLLVVAYKKGIIYKSVVISGIISFALSSLLLVTSDAGGLAVVMVLGATVTLPFLLSPLIIALILVYHSNLKERLANFFNSSA